MSCVILLFSIIKMSQILKMKNFNSTYFLFLLSILFSTSIFAEKPIECLLDVVVISSQKYAQPMTKHTSIKNDGSPMLLIGIDIQDARAAFSSTKMKNHQKYCASLIGQHKDAYLSGRYDEQNLQIRIDDQLKLRNIHSSGKSYPFWAEFYYLEKSE